MLTVKLRTQEKVSNSARTAIRKALHGVVMSLSLAASAGISSALFAAADAVPSVEMEFWRSAERIGTAEAYRAFLAAFPEGVFAPLARAALAKTSTPSPASSVPAVGANTSAKDAQAKPKLRYFSEPPPYTGSIAFNVGDRFLGPGPLTVGWLGAKKQVILPPGEWVVLGASDSNTGQRTFYRVNQQMPMVTLTLGKFTGDRLTAMLQFTSDIRPGEKVTWSDVARCELADATRLHFAKTQPTGMRTECFALRSTAKPLADQDKATLEVRRSLDRMGANMSGLATVTILTIAEPINGYLGITRMDWPAAVLGDDADEPQAWQRESVDKSAPRRAYVEALLAWAGTYQKVASQGYGRRLDMLDLLAGGLPVRQASPLVGEFDPPR